LRFSWDRSIWSPQIIPGIPTRIVLPIFDLSMAILIRAVNTGNIPVSPDKPDQLARILEGEVGE